MVKRLVCNVAFESQRGGKRSICPQKTNTLVSHLNPLVLVTVIVFTSSLISGLPLQSSRASSQQTIQTFYIPLRNITWVRGLYKATVKEGMF